MPDYIYDADLGLIISAYGYLGKSEAYSTYVK